MNGNAPPGPYEGCRAVKEEGAPCLPLVNEEGAAGRSGGGEGKGPDRGGARGSAGDQSRHPSLRAPEGTPTTVERPGAGGDQECCDPTPALREPPQATVAVCSWCRGRGCGLCNMSGRPTRSDSGSPRAKLAYLLRQQRDGTPRAADDVPTDAAVAATQPPMVYTMTFFETLRRDDAACTHWWQHNAALKWFSQWLIDEYESRTPAALVVNLEEAQPIPTILPGDEPDPYSFSQDREPWSWLHMIALLQQEVMEQVVNGPGGRSGGLVSCKVSTDKTRTCYCLPLDEYDFDFYVTREDGSVVRLHPHSCSPLVNAIGLADHDDVSVLEFDLEWEPSVLDFAQILLEWEPSVQDVQIHPSPMASPPPPPPGFKAPPPGLPPPGFKAPPPGLTQYMVPPHASPR